MSYFPTMANMTNVSDYTTYLNTTTSNLWGVIVLIGIFVLGLIMQRRIDGDSMIVSGFITIIIAVLFSVIGLVASELVLQFIVLGSVGALIAVIGKR